MLAAAAAPPIYGFGVDADAGAAKLYVQNRYGEAPPQLPAAAEAAMPPVFFKTTWCARKCKVGLLETLGNYCALQYAGRCCGKQHRKPDIKNWALKPGVLRVSELWTLEAERPLGAAAAGAPRLATGAEPTRLASFWHVHLLRALRC